jgi:ferredoxin-thioredoxin reductase catalytic subunit/rubredoxin
MTTPDVSEKEIGDLLNRLGSEAKSSGYFLNPDEAFAKDLVCGLIVNQRRYGYPSCPCRLASGSGDEDRDIVCPCDYRDSDIAEYGACFCALYVSAAAAQGKRRIEPVPERRPAPKKRGHERAPVPSPPSGLPHPVWRCRVCGYLCARDEPPDVCPICKVKKDRFERFM